ncbi:MAG TPA: trimeric intracellular cation channel family protein [Pyrinomonadaceae bacterium]|nr:trimeric intracellular cation channel family protein [Pyrinomonadaceae bacterium]
MIQPSVNQEALNALAEFTAYAASTLLVLDLIGTFVFALSGGVAGVKERLDLFGVLVLSFAAASAGGIMRDLLIGAVPPAAISDWRYLAVSVVAGLVVFFSYPFSERLPTLRNHILVFDAAGLALFAVAGTQKALGFRLNPVMAALLGMLTGIGGGMLRDVLVADVPAVLRSELYAVAALAGALLVVVGHMLNFPPTAVAIAGAALCFGIRFIAIRRGWRLPIAGAPPRSKSSADVSDDNTDKSGRN